MDSNPIYLDYAAATPLDSRVLTAMQPYFAEAFYNPSSPYLAARAVKRAVEEARARVAHWVGARPTEIIFTAGATESINLAIHGVMRQYPDAEIAVLAIEHPAVLNTARQYTHAIVPVLADGVVDVVALKAVTTERTALVSIGLANNEIGTIQPLRRVAELLQAIRDERRAAGNTLPLYLHSDASQAAGYLDIHAARLGVDLLTLNAGKIYGPKQTGLLYVRAGITLQPLIIGGGQELGLRSGTENVPNVIGFAAALDIAQSERKESAAKQAAMRDELQRLLQHALPHATVNGAIKKRLPNNLHLSLPGVDGERLVMVLDEHGLQAATGSACAANKNTASHVLQAIGLPDDLLQGSLRLTLGASTTPAIIQKAAQLIVAGVAQSVK